MGEGLIHLSMTAEYALRAVTCLSANADQPLSADLLAEQTKVPRRYLTRVLQDLAKAGLVASRPGPGGGYELIKSATELRILDVINAVSPLERIRACPLGLKSHQQLCPLHAELDKAYAVHRSGIRWRHYRSTVKVNQPQRPPLRKLDSLECCGQAGQATAFELAQSASVIFSSASHLFSLATQHAPSHLNITCFLLVSLAAAPCLAQLQFKTEPNGLLIPMAPPKSSSMCIPIPRSCVRTLLALTHPAAYC